MKPDSLFFRIMGKLGDLVLLNLLWLVCCLPIVTIGAATTALHYTAGKYIQQDTVSLFGAFFRSFRQNWKQATSVWMLLLALGLFVVAYYAFGTVTVGMLGDVLRGVAIAMGIVWLLLLAFVFPLLARYECRTKALLFNSLSIAVTSPLTAIICITALVAIPVLALLAPQVFRFLLLPWVLMGGSVYALLQNLLMKHICRSLEANTQLAEQQIEEE